MVTFRDIVNHIQTLPPLSPNTLRIRDLYRDGAENVNVIKLIRLIESDATLAANVLKFVNAPKYGFAKKISSVSQAVTLLGTEIIHGIVVDKAMQERLGANVSAYGITNIQFNDMCHLQSSMIIQWYSIVDMRVAHFLAPLALIMELGKLVIAKEVAQSAYTATFRRGLAEVSNVEAYEYDLFDTTSYYISALLFEHWNLDSRFVEILKIMDFEDKKAEERMEYYRDILDVVRTAINVKGILTQKSINNAVKKVQKMKLSESTFLHVANRMKRMYEQSKGIA
ncbi:hypothetical protein MNB_SM-7-108 [hydrothermal vent metagenome]|uniref:HDOD domain-containing protein n=1 Tax=hydrothermal vent metagenome TaxID=652676 RepID=A0A1W1C176_9ZZZZ